jgi:stage II sporulation protein D
LAETNVRLESGSVEESAKTYAVQVTTVRGRDQINGLLQRLREEFQQEEVTVKPDGTPEQQRVYLGRFADETDAGNLARRVKLAGYSGAKPVVSPPKPVLIARSPTNESLLRVPAQLTLAPVDETQARITFNGREYRGRLVVKLNARERLTVVNEAPLEEYLWSVVPNELGPTAFGELEALKAQAIAARTFAVRQKLNTATDDEYDILADVRSQVYTGVEAEHPLSTRAVNETRGIIMTHQGEPIEALYSSTCGGRTENSEVVFAEAKPYLRSVICAPEVRQFAARAITSQRRTSPESPVALLQVLGVNVPSEWTGESFQSPATADEISTWMTNVAMLLGRSGRVESLDKQPLTRLEGLAQSLVSVFYPADYVSVMLTPADVEYILDDADGRNWSPEARRAIAVLVRDGVLSLPMSGRLNPQAGLSRMDVLTALFRLAQRAGLIELKSGVIRRFEKNALLVQLEKGRPQKISLTDDPFLFKQIGDSRISVRRTVIAGGERAWFHTDEDGRVDYLVVQPNANGISRDRYSSASQWEVRLTPQELADRLRGRGTDVGDIVDLTIGERSAAQRIMLLQVIGTKGAKELRGSAIRAVLGLRENMFVIDRKLDHEANVVEFVFAGRGWGHGVGLCQVGAYGLALEGASYADILRAYYTGVDIAKIY